MEVISNTKQAIAGEFVLISLHGFLVFISIVQ